MATILNFRSRSQRPASVVEAQQATGAEIIIFPGVRIERCPDRAKPSRRDRTRTQRDRLEIPD
jgi:hypothetical protein